MTLEDNTLSRLTLAVTGMKCGGCVTQVEEALRATPGVHEAKVDLENGRAAVAYDPAAVTPELLAAAVTGAGFSAVPGA